MFKNLRISFFLASKSIKRGNIGTTILTIITMSLIFVNLIFLPSIISGIGEALNQQFIDGSYANLVIEPKEDDLYIDNVDSIQKKLNRLDGMVGTSPRYVAGATFTHRKKIAGGTIRSINPVDEEVVTQFHARMIEGEYLSKADTDEIIMGVELAGKEGIVEEQPSLDGVKIGDKISVTFNNGAIKEYRLKGIFEISVMGPDRFAFITEKEMESVLGLDNQASEILVKISQRGAEEEFRKKFKELGISEDIKTWEEKTAGMMGKLVSSFSLIKLISTVISLIMAIVVIFIVIYINTVHKRRQMGILKAIGIDQRAIVHSYVMQASFFCFCGIALGSFLLYFLMSYLTANPLDFAIGNVKPLIEQGFVIQSIVSLIIVSLIAGFIPSWKIARENILKAIWG
jgi:putative ABC transport system permease protein